MFLVTYWEKKETLWHFFIDRVQLFQGWDTQQRNSLLLITISLSLVLLGDIMRFCRAATSFYNINNFSLSQKTNLYILKTLTHCFIFSCLLYFVGYLSLSLYEKRKQLICTFFVLVFVLLINWGFLENIIWLETVFYTGHQISGMFLLLLCSLIMQFYSE